LGANDAIDGMGDSVSSVLRGYGFPDELKWTTTSRSRLQRDLEAVSCFWRLYGTGERLSGPRFQCLVADQHQLNIRKFHDGDTDKCFYKLLYPLLVRRIGAYASPGEDVHVALDRRSTKYYDLNEFREILGHGLRKNLGSRLR